MGNRFVEQNDLYSSLKDHGWSYGAHIVQYYENMQDYYINKNKLDHYDEYVAKMKAKEEACIEAEKQQKERQRLYRNQQRREEYALKKAAERAAAEAAALEKK